MTAAPFDPADARCWLERGRSAAHAQSLADVWRRHPDLPPSASPEERMARGRARIAAMRPLNDAIAAETEMRRQATNFAFTEKRVRYGHRDEREIGILHARHAHGYDWDGAIRYADGWYAARSGGDYRPFVSGASGQAAYDQGFRDGGGDTADLFDSARRSIRATTRTLAEAVPMTPAAARPCPSSWPKPTDAPRPARWERRLVIIAGEDVQPAGPYVPAIDHFQGALFDTIRAHDGASAAVIVILSPAHGFIAATDTMRPNPGTFSPARASALASDEGQGERLRQILHDREFDDILVVADGRALDVIDAHASALPLSRTMERTRHTPLLQRAQLRLWLDRGFAPGAVMASGHIRWGKVIHGLTGRLGDFSARYAGAASEGGHLLVVEIDGHVATGFMAPDGTPLEPRIRFSNRSKLRGVMALALRTFAASMPMAGAAITE